MASTLSNPPTTGGRSWLRLDIQGLRAVAVLLVVTYHAGLPIPGGFTGVDVFFVISGFVITELILRNQASPSGFRLRAFYTRRMKRLLPALALMTTVTLIIAIWFQSPFGPQRTTALTGLGASFFSANFVIYANTGGYFDAPAELNPLLHTWSLSVEEQFYFVFPALMILAATLAARRRLSARGIALVAVSLIAIASFAASVTLGFGLWQPDWLASPVSWAFYSSITRAWEFAVGAIIALVLFNGKRSISCRTAALSSVIGFIAIIAGALFITSDMVFPGLIALLPVFGTAAVIIGGSGDNSPAVSSALALPGMVWIGALSYSWYLWHWPAIVFTRQLVPDNEVALLIAGFGSLLPAWLAYRFVENPIRTSTRLTGLKALTTILLAIAVPAATAWFVLNGAQRSWDNTAIKEMSQQIAPIPVSYMRGCDFGTPLGQQQDLDCTWHPGARGAPIYLVGDSQAAQFAEATINAAEPLERSVTIATEGSCPFIVTREGEEPLSSPECEAYVNQSLEWLTNEAPATVLIGMSGNYVTEEFEEQLAIRLTRSIETLTQAGHEVQLFQAIPQFPEWSPFNCTVWDATYDADGCGISIPARVMDDRQAPAIRMFTFVANETGVRLIDVRSGLLSNDNFVTNDEDTWRYRDMFHISVGESERLTSMVRSALL